MQSLKPTLGARLYDMQCKVTGVPGTLRLAAGQLGAAHAVLLSGLSIAAALVFLGLSGRYQFVLADTGAVRGDRLTGSIDLCIPASREERGADGSIAASFSRLECMPELKQ